MLIGTVLEGATIPIQAVSAFFIMDDIIMLSQLYYYTHIYKKHKLPTTVPMTTPGNSKQTVAMFAIALISTGALTANTFLVSSSNAVSRSLLQEGPYCDNFGRSPLEQTIGSWFIWAGSAIYFLSRIPQVFKNWQNQQCDGLSIGMFLMFAIANITYGGQVILKAILNNMDFNTFMERKFNFVIGSCGVLFFDVVIIIQSKIYNHASK
ncbi:hypothetical protein BVRB_029230 [Beta vulgaris subsp. vulgaris]|uniref:Uncharacterized protein n=1 Tax=Beta vulgaris subsp. vulgaris TaxID=3555 RepID=A0A0J8DSF1_BETVV|nr:hypothetical protein BVRB_029230 [Beta vulgaris subsp. vulgaris]